MSTPLVLIIDDDQASAVALQSHFEKSGFNVLLSSSGSGGLSLALREVPDTVILDLRLPDRYGLDILSAIHEEYPEIPVIVATRQGEIDEAVKAVKMGAEHYFQKPVNLDELMAVVEKCLRIKQIMVESSLHKGTVFPMAGRSKHIQGLIHMINLLASNPSTTVMIQGETGTGKELVARNIHAMSPRCDKPFIDVNCAAIPENILESELFGYEAGAFTDAKKTKKGLFELADEGTLFLDEIGDMPKSAQAKILRVLENRTIKRLGGTRDISVDVRVTAATNRDLQALVKDGAFREDLYYRLNVMPLCIPPLRERPEDIPLIAEYLLSDLKKSMNKKGISGFSEGGMEILRSYPWPGNVREMKNVIERAVILCTGGIISGAHLSGISMRQSESVEESMLTLSAVEKKHIADILQTTSGNRTRAAAVLGIARSTLNEKLKLYGIN